MFFSSDRITFIGIQNIFEFAVILNISCET